MRILAVSSPGSRATPRAAEPQALPPPAPAAGPRRLKRRAPAILAGIAWLLPILAEPAGASGPAVPSKCEPGHVWQPIDRRPDGRPPKKGETGGFRVWYRKEAWKDSAEAFADSLEKEVWPRLTRLMGRNPLSDDAWDCKYDKDDDGRLDIYVDDNDKDGTTYRFQTAEDSKAPCKGVPTWIRIGAAFIYPAGQPRRDWMKVLAAHEFMHVLQYTYKLKGNCIDPRPSPQEWWAEASAVWAQDYVLKKTGQHEHESAKAYLDAPEHSLHSPVAPDAFYRAYLYPFWLSHDQCPGEDCVPTVIREIWEAMLEESEAIEAIGATVAGGWAETFPQFAAANLNQGDLDDYKRWDALCASVAASHHVLGPGDRVLLPNPVLHPLASRVYRLEPGERVRLLQVENGWKGLDDAHLQAVRQPPGGSLRRPGPGDDWTQREYARLCLDDADERVSQLFLVASSSSTDDPQTSFEPKEIPEVAAWDVPCKRIQGNTRYDWTQTMTALTTTWTLFARGEATVFLEAVDTGDPEEVLFRVAEGDVTWELGSHASDPQHSLDVRCSTGPVIEPIDPDDGFVVFRLRGAPGVSGPGYTGSGITTVGEMDYRCERSGVPLAGSPMAPIPHRQASWFDTGGRYFELDAGGNLTGSASGSTDTPFGRQEWTSEWTLVPVADPDPVTTQ